MRIIVWGINYAPELTGIAPFNTGLCDFLRSEGHQVEMVTTFPYYPYWQKIPGDRGRVYRKDDFDGVCVHRCWHYVPRRVTTLARIWHEFSFGLTSLLRVLCLARADVYVVISPPLMLGVLAAFVGWLKQRPYVFHVQDLQPDAAVGLGMLKPTGFTHLLYCIEAFSYRRATLVSGISQGMLAAYERKGVPSAKTCYFPNWIRWYGRNEGLEGDDAERAGRAGRFRQKFRIPADVFLASYSGNLGRKQGLDTLVEAAALLAANENWGELGARRIHLLIVGDGAARQELESRIAARGLQNLRLIPLLIESDYHGMLAASDVGLILQASGTGQYFLPSKLLSVLSLNVPVVTAADASSELARAVKEGGFGVNVPPHDATALAKTLVDLAGDRARLEQLGRRTQWVEQFAGVRVLEPFQRKLIEIAERGPRCFENT